MKICILKETKFPPDARVPLTPGQCRILEEKMHDLKIVVQPSSARCFPDASYVREGITVSDDIKNCDLFLGVKEVTPENLIEGKTYMFFSHTIKRQEHNKKLLEAVLARKITLIDYELLTDENGSRIIGFGRWAGLIGSYLGIRAYAARNKMEPMPGVKEFKSFSDMTSFARICKLPPLKIVITGDGRVGKGACEMMDFFRIRKVDAEDFLKDRYRYPVYTLLHPGLYNKRKEGSFDLLHFFNNPRDYESDFVKYISVADILISAAFWDPRAPVLFRKEHLIRDDFNIKVIADISCDLNGPIPTTIMATTFDEPYYDYDRFAGTVKPAFSDNRNITVMSIDNLPCGLPAEASADFGQALINQVLPLFASEDKPVILERATIADKGRLTSQYGYLADWVNPIENPE